MRSCTLPLLLALLFSAFVSAHGDHYEALSEEASKDWATRHMAEEHHITNFDPTSFFTLHDFDSAGTWTRDTVRRFYGLDDESLASTSEAQKVGVIDNVFAIFDIERTGVITKEQFLRLFNAGRRLPDSGLGPGHHGDDEYEYEIHHFERYHGEDAKEEDLTHPEDIEHFRKHDMLEDEADRLAELEKMPVVEANIPSKFRKQGS